MLSPARTTVHIEALVTQIPGHIELDIGGIEVGDALRISDLPDVEGVTYLDDPEEVVVSVTVPAAEEEPEVLEGEEAAEAEGEEAAGEEEVESAEAEETE